MRAVNSPAAVLNTYRDRMIAQFAEARVPFVASRLVATSGERVAAPRPVWVKRGRRPQHAGGRRRLRRGRLRRRARARGPGGARHPARRHPAARGRRPDQVLRHRTRRRRPRRAAVVPVVLPQGPEAPAPRLRRARARAARAPGGRRARPRDLRRRLHRDRLGRARPDRPQRVAELRALPRGGGLRHRRVPVGALRRQASR